MKCGVAACGPENDEYFHMGFLVGSSCLLPIRSIASVCVCVCVDVCVHAQSSPNKYSTSQSSSPCGHMQPRLWQSAWQHSFTNTHYPPTAPYPCSCPREGPSRSKADKHTHTHSSIKIWCRLNVEQAAVKKRDGQQAEKWKNTKLHVLKHRR